MALKDFMDKTSDLLDKTSNLIDKSADNKRTPGGGIAQGLAGNAREMSKEAIQKEFGMYFMSGEVVKLGYQLIRDVFVVTDRRIIDFDKQGATGKKMSIKSIYLDSIIDVDAETAGFGLDDSEITIHYITTPFHKAHSISTDKRKFEFPKKYDITSLYIHLQQMAYDNYCKLNA